MHVLFSLYINNFSNIDYSEMGIVGEKIAYLRANNFWDIFMLFFPCP